MNRLAVSSRAARLIGLDFASVRRGLWLGSAIGTGFTLGQYVAEWLR